MSFVELVLSATTKGLKKGADALDHLADEGERTERRTKKSTGGIGRGFTSMGSTIAKAAGGAVLALASLQQASAGIQQARGFNAALAETSTLIEGTAAEMSLLSNEARRMAVNFGTGATAQVDAFYSAISGGADGVAAAAEILDVANRLAIGGKTDVTTATKILNAALNVYTDEGLTATEVSDALFVAMAAGETKIGELAASLGKVLPFAQKVGVSFDEVAAATAALTKGGISTAESVTGIKASLVAVIRPTKDALDLARDLNLEFSVGALRAQGYAGFMQSVTDATGGSAEALATLFSSTEASAVAMTLAGAAGVTLGQTLVDMAGKAGQADTAFMKIAKSFDTRWKKAASAAADVALRFGNIALTVVVPALEATAWALTLAADGIEYLGYGLVVMAATQLPSLIAMTYSAATAISVIEFQFIAGAVAATGLATAAGVARGALMLLGGPIGLALGAATALGLALYSTASHAETVKNNAFETAQSYHEASNYANLLVPLAKEQATAMGEMQSYLDEIAIQSGTLTDHMARQYELAGKTRAEGEKAAKPALEMLQTYRDQEAITRAIMIFGEGSAEAAAAKWAEEEHSLRTQNESLSVSAAMKQEIVDAARAAFDAEGATVAWASAMSGVRAEVNAILPALSSLGGGVISNAAKQAEVAALQAGKSIRAAAQAGIDLQREATFDARAQGANWFERQVIEFERDVARYGVALDDQLDNERKLARDRGRPGKGGSGSSSGTRDANQLLRERDRILDSLMTSQERYSDDLADLNELHRMGYLDADQYRLAINQVGQEFEASRPFAQEWKDSLIDAAMGGANAFDGLLNSIKRAGVEMLLFNTGPLADLFSGGRGGSSSGSLFGGFFKSILGFASGTNFAPGGIAMVGERGPELVNLPRGSQVVPNHKLGQSVGGGTSVVRVELGEGLVGSILKIAGGQSVQISQATAQQQQASLGGSIGSFDERGIS